LRITSFGPPDWSRWLRDVTEIERAHLIAPVLERIRRAFNGLAATSALVIDLRGNAGGTDLLGLEVAAHLLPTGSVYFQLSARDAYGSWSVFEKERLTASTPLYSHPVAVLIDEGTFSAADNLAACLRDLHPHVVFVGRPTGGGTGALRIVTLPRTCAQVSFSTVRVLSPRGRPIEGSGTSPDVALNWTQQDYAEGHDPDLEAALTALGEPSVDSSVPSR